MLLKLTEARYLKDYQLFLKFNDHSSGVVDLRDKIFHETRDLFRDLEDKNFFQNFKLDRWTIHWENGLDLAPEFLHEMMLKQAEKPGAKSPFIK